jgi:preprotein translocase subunit SecG
MIYGSIISAIFVIGFAYIILVLANKESGNMKLAGQIVAALVAIVAVVVLLYGATGRGHYGMMGGKGMMMGGKGMMMEMMKKDPSMMQDMCKNKEMREMMQKGLKKYGK